MSCGNHHDVDCSQILDRVYVFIDNELDSADCQSIQRHLQECGPCLAAVDLERMVKALVSRSCKEQAPVELRQRVLVSIREVQIQQGNAAPSAVTWSQVDTQFDISRGFGPGDSTFGS
ncbi:MAG: mycothiol system anti-sigma-R factor [Nocardioidaceae bacterium]